MWSIKFNHLRKKIFIKKLKNYKEKKYLLKNYEEKKNREGGGSYIYRKIISGYSYISILLIDIYFAAQ